MDSLGMIAQQKDAEAVLATLWDVNDASTSRLMSDFYFQMAQRSVSGKKRRPCARRSWRCSRGRPHLPMGAASAALKDCRRTGGVGLKPAISHPFYWGAVRSDTATYQ